MPIYRVDSVKEQNYSEFIEASCIGEAVEIWAKDPGNTEGSRVMSERWRVSKIKKIDNRRLAPARKGGKTMTEEQKELLRLWDDAVRAFFDYLHFNGDISSQAEYQHLSSKWWSRKGLVGPLSVAYGE